MTEEEQRTQGRENSEPVNAHSPEQSVQLWQFVQFVQPVLLWFSLADAELRG
jgi:hypothetical protein